MSYNRQATQALNTNMIPAPPSNEWGDNILHTLAFKKDTELMQWALNLFGEDLISKRNIQGDTVMHQLVQGLHQLVQEDLDLYTDKLLKIIEMFKHFLGDAEFKHYVGITNKKKHTACALARMNHAGPEVIKRLNPAYINIEKDTQSPRVPFASDQPPRSDIHHDALFAIFCYKGNLRQCKWFFSYFGNNKEEVLHQNINGENALHQLFKATGFSAVANLTRLGIIIEVRKHIWNTWGAATYTELLAQENNSGLSVLSLAIENGGDIKVVRELLAGMSPGDQSFIIQKQGCGEESPLDLAGGSKKEILYFLNDVLQKNRELATEELEQPIDNSGLEIIPKIIDNLNEDEERCVALKEKNNRSENRIAILEKKIERLQREHDEARGQREIAEVREREVKRVLRYRGGEVHRTKRHRIIE